MTKKRTRLAYLDENQRAIYRLYMKWPNGLPTWTEISQTLQMSQQRIGAAMWELEAAGLLDHAMPDLTDEQRHVLYTLPPKEDGRGMSKDELAEQLGMDVADVHDCVCVLKEKGWAHYSPDNPIEKESK